MDKSTEPKSEPQSRHVSMYWQLRPFWETALAMKEVLPGEMSRFLFRYQKEDDSEYRERQKRAAQINVVHGIIEFYCAMLFTGNIQMSAKGRYAQDVKDFEANCTLQGHTFKEFLRELVAPTALLYGVCDVFGDLPSTNEQIRTLADEQAFGVDRPYLFIVPPLNRIDWSLDRAGRYTSYKSIDVIDTQIQAQYSQKDNSQWQDWTEWTVENYKEVSGKEEKVAIPNPYGFIPAVPVIPLPSLRFFKDAVGLSLVQDIMHLQKLVLNIISLMMDAQENSNYAQMLIINDLEGVPVTPEEGEEIEMGPKRTINLYGKDSDAKLLSPDPGNSEAMLRFLCQIIDMIYASVFISDATDNNKTHQTSGSIRANNTRLYSYLSKIAKHLERSSRQILELMLRLKYGSKFNAAEAAVNVQWDTNFSFEAPMYSIQELTALKQAFGGMSPTAIKAVAKKVIAPLIYNTGDLPKTISEIDAYSGPVTDDPSTDDVIRKQDTQIKAAEVVEDQ